MLRIRHFLGPYMWRYMYIYVAFYVDMCGVLCRHMGRSMWMHVTPRINTCGVICSIKMLLIYVALFY